MKHRKNTPLIIFVVGVVILSAGVVFYERHFLSSAMVLSVDQLELTPTEKDQILTASEQKVKENSMPNLKYTLSIKKHVNNYVLVDVAPAIGEQVDPAQVILEKKNNVWEATDFGTSFGDLYQKVPKLFE